MTIRAFKARRGMAYGQTKVVRGLLFVQVSTTVPGSAGQTEEETQMPMPAHMTLEGETQGNIEGSCTMQGREGTILVQSW